ncbi:MULTISPECIES: hypothetical protein [Enterobacteriaceae]|jgi:hypothetical protein|uniref:hypothetical protein n=1 Tax=Enterobacteriaceae TaxID=543 RepID=UPI0007D6D918|nr:MULTISPECIES: hypothetical protein [Enterobacteriaceae]ELJ2050636.1 hypothetical protein [Citrobacter freundii]ELT0797039.1 hypothetical protein [Klebsiella quasipneumoniae]EMA8102731.1 hypothetical protein [Klebsiella quasipneumoniae]MBC4644052.1 hypothetical protein [Klebsiella quasipneumoniae]MBC4694596.1 hypothetical protein [Klebsiella quasipneumoniae]
MNRANVDTFEKISGQLLSIYEEISLLSKKSPNDAVNKFKLKFVNKLLSQSNDYLGEMYKPFDDFDSFDEDDIPQNSDVVFILSQYLQCFEKQRSDNVVIRNGNWFWRVIGEATDKVDEDGMVLIRTVKPKKLKD